ncbi:MAG TPA: hypothetical protein VIX59_05495 [Candidatus Binataceae bacterium]
MHRRHHQLEGGIDDGAGFLGVEVLLQFGGALDVGKQRGDCLALAVELAGRFNQVGDPCPRARWCGSGRSRSVERCTAISTESLSRRVFCPAFWAMIAQFRATVAAELLARRNFGAATRAAHESLDAERTPKNYHAAAVLDSVGNRETATV